MVDLKTVLENAKSIREQSDIEVRIDKQELIDLDPEIAGALGMELMGDKFILNIAAHESFQVKDLREICQKCTDADFAAQKRASLMGLPDDSKVVILKRDAARLRNESERKVITSLDDLI